jgi:steroid delta-isomerase-like uncharacterized protein
MAIPKLDQAWNARTPESVSALFTPDGVRHQFSLPEGRFAGREAINGVVGAIMHAVPDCELTIRGAHEAGDTATVEWTFSGTLTNDFPGLPANGQRVTLHAVSVCTMDGELIREERVYWDTATLMAAAGVLPS